MDNSIGEHLSPILAEIENMLWGYEDEVGDKPNFTMDGFRAATKIFMSVMMDKIFELQSNESMDIEDRLIMVEKCGSDIRQLIKTYTNLDSKTFYDSINNEI